MSFSDSESDVLKTVAGWLAQGHPVALATVVRTSGSAPRQEGSHIAIRDDRAFAGSVSAGCGEGIVVENALATLRDGKHRNLAFGLSENGGFSVGLGCGGEIEILIEPIAA
jgi:xanthine dehydrogenase accessory factor